MEFGASGDPDFQTGVNRAVLVLSEPAQQELMMSIGRNLIAAASGCQVAYISAVYELPPIIPLGQDRLLAIEVAQKIYFGWYTHLASYTIGSLTAYSAITHVKSLKRCLKSRISWVRCMGISSLLY